MLKDKIKDLNEKTNKEHGNQNTDLNMDVKEIAARMKSPSFDGKTS